MRTATDTVQQWFILRGQEKYGPFEYSAMIHMLQRNELFDYNYVWSAHLDQWTPLGDVPEFTKDRLARLIENGTSLRNSFAKRSSPRADVAMTVYAHDGQQFFDGRSLSLSENGALLLLNTPLLLPEQEIVVHFRNESANVSFNVRARIIRKNFTRARINVKSGLHYAVRFTEVPEAGLKALKTLVREHTKEAGQ